MALLDELEIIPNETGDDPILEAQRYTDQTQLNPINAYIESLRPVRDEDRIKRQKQIASYNALGQGLTNIIDLVSQGKGAFTPVRDNATTTNRLMQALTAEDQKFQQDQARFESAKLGQLIRDVNLQQKQEAAEGERVRKAGELEEERTFKTQEKKTAAETAQELENLRSANTLKEIQARNRGAASKAEQTRIRKAQEDKFPVITGRRDERGNELEAGISEAQYNNVIQYANSIPNLNWDEATQKFLDGKGNKFNRDDIVTKYWKDIYEVDRGGNVVLRPDIDKDRVRSRGDYFRYTEDIKDKTFQDPTRANKTVSTGGAY
jgi:hypothetical protein